MSARRELCRLGRHALWALVALCLVGLGSRHAGADQDDEREAVRKGALAYWDAFVTGDKDAYHGAMISHQAFALAEAVAQFDHAAAGRRLHDALVKKFGAEGEKLSTELTLSPPDTTRPRIAEAKITVKGLTATLEHDDGQSPLKWKLRKDADLWKFDPAPDAASNQKPGANLNTFDRVAKARDTVAQDVAAGRLAAVADARASLEKLSKPLRPSSRPSTRRGSSTTRRTTTRPAAG